MDILRDQDKPPWAQGGEKRNANHFWSGETSRHQPSGGPHEGRRRRTPMESRTQVVGRTKRPAFVAIGAIAIVVSVFLAAGPPASAMACPAGYHKISAEELRNEARGFDAPKSEAQAVL